MVLLDTCTLIWWALIPEELSPAAVEACGRMEREGGVISSISIWEIGVNIKNRKLDIGIPLRSFVARVKATGAIEIVPLDETMWMANLDLRWDHRDPADRTIVATAKLRKLPIVTPDERIASFYRRTIW